MLADGMDDRILGGQIDRLRILMTSWIFVGNLASAETPDAHRDC